MQSVKYINPIGREVVFNLTPPYIFESIKGVGADEATLFTTQSAGQDGTTYRNLVLTDREITLTFHVKGKNRQDMYKNRQLLIATLSQGLNKNGRQGRLEYTNDYGTWWIPAVIKTGVNADRRISNYNHCQIVFYCADPYWRAMEPHIEKMAYIEGNFKFPLDIDFDTGVSFGRRGYSNKIYNEGDSPCPVRIEIDGAATEPCITNVTTGEYIKLKKSLYVGDKLIIDTYKNDLKVEIVTSEGTDNGFGYLDLKSTLFYLQPGENELTFSSTDEAATTAIVIIEAYARFGGV